MAPNFSEFEDPKDTQCGYFCWRGGFWQMFTSIKIYVVIYGLAGLLHVALGSYMVAIITTIEKRFKIPSRTSGIIMSSWDIGSLICLILLAYVGSKGHKPRWVSAGAFLQAFACYLWILPYQIYGPGRINNNVTSTGYKCDMGPPSEDVCEEGEESFLSSSLLFSACLLLGIGSVMYYTLGLSYLDDNSRKDKMPLLLSSTMAIRMIGPSVGFMLGSHALSFYENPLVDPGITPEDPRWIGAWWMGIVPLGILTLIVAFLIWPFPRHLPRAYKRKLEAKELIDNSELSFKDLKLLMGRLLTNKVLIYNTISSTLYMFGMMGYWTFMPKYLETQFQLSASQANLVSGTVGLACTGLGTLSSGVYISKWKPRPETLALWNVIVEMIDVIGHASYAFLGCPSNNLQGHWDLGSWNMTTSCNAFCGCGSDVKYAPLCTADGSAMFYSPCHAGCLSDSFNTTSQMYERCGCAPSMGLASGPCPVDCTLKFNIFIVVLCTMRFFSATGRAGNTIIQFRSVSDGDKAVSIGFTEAVMCAFAFIPAPIFYGALLDYSCLVWGEICGETGNCWLYDGQTVRYYINFVSAGLLLLATMADVGVWLNSSHLQIYDKDPPKETSSPQELLPLHPTS